MNNIIAFDCSSNDLSIYLRKGTEEYFTIRRVGLRHSEKLLPLIDGLMKEANLSPQDLDLIACAKGPGSFTGLRIAMATAKGIASATATPLVSVLTPDFLVAKAPEDQIAVVTIDAKKRRYYGRIYLAGEALSAPLDISPSDLALLLSTIAKQYSKKIFITGPDAPKAYEELVEAMKEKGLDYEMGLDPFYNATRIDALASLALKQFNEKGADLETSGPLYIRRSEAEEAMNLEISTTYNSKINYQV